MSFDPVAYDRQDLARLRGLERELRFSLYLFDEYAAATKTIMRLERQLRAKNVKIRAQHAALKRLNELNEIFKP